jgi:hypothetical protein
MRSYAEHKEDSAMPHQLHRAGRQIDCGHGIAAFVSRTAGGDGRLLTGIRRRWPPRTQRSVLDRCVSRKPVGWA